nr:uncharacterized protein LOC129387568 isoform X1 [Dermacentor andersoni]
MHLHFCSATKYRIILLIVPVDSVQWHICLRLILQMFEVFPYAIAAFEADDDGDLDCGMVVRQDVDQNRKTAVYVLVLPSLNGRQAENQTMYIKEGPTTDRLVFTTDDGADGGGILNYIYTNNKNCAVVDFPFKKRQSKNLYSTRPSGTYCSLLNREHIEGASHITQFRYNHMKPTTYELNERMGCTNCSY